MEYNENTDYVSDEHDGDVVTLVSNVGGRKDRKFSRNYAWAKHAADRGKVRRIVIKVVANGENYRTLDTFRRAVGKPHPAARLLVDGPVQHAMAVVDDLTKLVPGFNPAEEKPVKPRRRVEPPVEPVTEPTEPEVNKEETE
jgi:hypothetical protein